MFSPRSRGTHRSPLPVAPPAPQLFQERLLLGPRPLLLPLVPLNEAPRSVVQPSAPGRAPSASGAIPQKSTAFGTTAAAAAGASASAMPRMPAVRVARRSLATSLNIDGLRWTIRRPDIRRPDPRPGRERFFRRDRGIWVLAVVEFGELPAIIVTVFSADQPPS